MADKTVPKTHLRLEWVYGYRGHQCRNNLFYSPIGDIIYFVAGVGIVYNSRSQTQRFFLGHDDDIISLALHPSQPLVATGQTGKNPYICVWNSSTMKMVSMLKDQHTHGIACLAFSTSGEKLASVGLDGNCTLVLWDWKSGRMLATTKGHTDRVFDITWDASSEMKLITCGVKHIKFWTLCGNSLTSKRGIFGKAGDLQTILCVTSGPNQLTYSGAMNGDILVWRDNNLEKTIPGAHAGAIHSMFKCSRGFATGSKDSCVKLWDANFNETHCVPLSVGQHGYKGLTIRSVCWMGDMILAGTQNGEIFEVSMQRREALVPITLGHGEGELWGLSIHPKKPVAATASDDLTVRVWTLYDHTMVARYNLDHPARSCAFNNDGTVLAVGCKNGAFYVLRTRDMKLLLHIQDRKEVLHEMKFSPDGSYLAVASNDNFVDIYSTSQNYKRVATCSKSSSFITHLDWSTDGRHIQTNDGAGERLVYSMPGGRHVTNVEEIRAIQWQSWTCVLGSEVNGMWPKYSQINDVNAVDASIPYDTLATGDDFGLVKLFRFPCLKKGAQFRKYVGHSAHVTNVRFSCDNHWLLSTGGADHALFQWVFITDDKATDKLGEIQGQEDLVSDSYSDNTGSGSDVSEVDSELEQEAQITYERDFYKEDLAALKQAAKKNVDKKITKKKRKTLTDSASLHLSHVFGYRGFDCRNNIFYTDKNEIVYHVAAVVIIYSIAEKEQRFYNKHDDDILCLTPHPLKAITASGQVGKDPTIHVFDLGNLSTISVLKGFHERGVSCLAFSGDGKKLVSIGLDNDHSMAIWDWRKGQKLATSKTYQDKVFCVCFDPENSEKLVTCGVKHIKFWNHVGGGCTSRRGVFGEARKIDSILCLVCCKDGITYSGAASGQIYMWKDNKLVKTQTAHDGPCYAMCALDKGFVTGGKDCTVRIWDATFEKCIRTYPVGNNCLSENSLGRFVDNCPSVRAIFLGPRKILVGTKTGEIAEIDKDGPVTILTQGHAEGEVWGLAYHPLREECATVSNDKTLRTWCTKHKEEGMLKAIKLTVGGQCCSYSPDGNAIAVGCNDGSFMVVSSTNLEQLVTFHHRKEAISDIKFSPGSGKYLAVGSHDNFVDIYNVLGSKRVGTCKGASSYITHLDWDSRGKLLGVNTGAKELLYFEAPRGKRQTVSTDEGIEWATWTSVLGKTCEGIWPAYSDVTDVNAACLSSDKKYLITGDDFGFVKLFHFPVKGKHAPCKKYGGHSAHVTNVRWSQVSNQGASTGGGDTALFIWERQDLKLPKSEEGLENTISYRGNSDESDTDSEEEGYDSDVEREAKMDYSTKIYAVNMRETTGTKPNLQEKKEKEKPKASRGIPETERVKKGKASQQNKILDLKLQHIFGYRGFDCRDNLHYLTNDATQIVYHAAGAGIVQDLKTNTQSFYLEHTDDIICLTINQHPKFPNVIATGQIGASPSIHIWDALTKTTLGILKGFHVGGVCSLNFSASGKLLLSVGLDEQHSVAVWRWQESAMVSSHFCSRQRIFNAQFRPDSDTNFVTVGVKHVMFWQVCGGALLGKKGVLGAVSGIQSQTMLSIAFGSENTTFTGAMNGDVYVWKDALLNRVVTKAHSGPVFTMYTTLKDGLIVTGGKEIGADSGNALKLWDQDMRRCKAFSLNDSVVKSVCRAKSKILVGTKHSEVLEVPERNVETLTVIYGHTEGELWGLACHPTSNICCTTSLDKTVKLWDINEKQMIENIRLKAGSRACAFSRDGTRLAVGQENGELVIFDIVSVATIATKRDRSEPIYDVRFSPDDKIVAVASEQSLDFYEWGKKTGLVRVGYCKQIPHLVFQLDFSKDGKYVHAGTGAYKQLIFEVPSGNAVTDPKIISKITWDSWTSVLGDDVIGIWPKNCDNADVNCADVSHAGNVVATGDDFGFVKLFDFPSREKFAKSRKFVGHSAHVTNARFTFNDSKLITTGGDDCWFPSMFGILN